MASEKSQKAKRTGTGAGGERRHPGRALSSTRRRKHIEAGKKPGPSSSPLLLANLQILKGLADPAIIYDRRRIVIGANAAAKKACGFDPAGMIQSAVINKLSSHTIAGKNLKRRDLISAKALSGKSSRDYEYHFTDARGRERTVSSSAAPIKSGKKIIGALVVWRDVTEQRRMQQELVDLSRFPSENPNPVFRIDESGTVFFRNPSAQLAFGRPGCEIGQPLPAGLRRLARQAWKTGRAVKGEVKGKKQIFHVAVMPIKRSGYLNIYCLDITERKQLDDELKRVNEGLEERVWQRTLEVTNERQRLYAVLEMLPVYVILLDKDYRVPFANKFFRERFGESLGKRCYEYLFHKDKPCETCETYKVLKTGATQRWEWIGPDGRIYDIYDYPFIEADGSTLILEMGIDITDRRKGERELVRIQAEMANSKRLSSIGTLAATVAHELRTPLGTIGLAAANLRKKAANPALAGHIEQILRKVEVSSRIISNLLTYTRIQMPHYEAVHLDRVVKEALNSVRERYSRSDVRVTNDLAPLGKPAAEADEVQLLEIFDNIITNAYQAIGNRKGSIDVRGRIENGETAVATIQDDGEGIDEDEMKRIFEPFYSGKRTGTGLGLALSKELIELHGGSINVASKKGKGTTVTVTIPLSRGV